MDDEIRAVLVKGAAQPQQPLDVGQLYRRGLRQRWRARAAAGGVGMLAVIAAVLVLPAMVVPPPASVTFEPSPDEPNEIHPAIVYRSCPQQACGLFVRESSGQIRRLTDGMRDRSPTWSPDGNRIAFTRGDSGGGLFAIDLDGSHLQLLSDEVASGPQWSSDGRWVAFLRGEAGRGDATELAVVPSDGSHGMVLTTDAQAFVWAPDGRRLAVLVGADRGQPELRVVTVTGDMESIRPLEGLYAPSILTLPAWSPTRDRILFAAAETPGQFRNAVLFEAAADGTGALRRVSEADHLPHADSWSPDGSLLAVSRASAPHQVVESTVDILEPDGSLTASMELQGRSAFLPSWSEDGMRLYALTWSPEAGGHWGAAHLTVTDGDGQNPRDLVTGVAFDYAVAPQPGSNRVGDR